MERMKGKSLLVLSGLVAPLLMAIGGVVYAITGEMGTLSLALIWIGLLLLLLFFYINFSEIKLYISKRSTRYGANMALMVAVFTAILVLIGMMSVKYKLRIDLTEHKRYSLSKQTVKILKSLDRNVEAIAFYRSDERTRQEMFDLLEEYSYYSPKFNFWFVDPDKKPLEAAKYGVTSYRTTLIRSGDKEETVGFESEDKLTNALIKATRDEVKTIYFVTGHGENNIEDNREYGYKNAQQSIIKENYQVRELILVGEEDIPDDASVLIVSGPQKDFAQGELHKIDKYVKNGGSALFMLDPAPLPKLSHFLKKYDFNVQNDIVVDKLIRITGTNYLTPVVTQYHKEHPITRDLTNVYTFFPIVRSVEIAEDPARGNYNLAKTSANSWARSKGKLDEDNLAFDASKDVRGPLSIMSVNVVEAKKAAEDESNEGPDNTSDGQVQKWGKIVVIGDSNFASNTHIRLAGNKDLFLNTIGWLAEEHALISVRKKERGVSPVTLTDSEERLVFWLSVIIVPSFIMVIGVGIISRRRLEV